MKHYRGLDGVRGIAALMIVFFHFMINQQPQGGFLLLLKRFSFFLTSGVSLFFVLSGFLITRILLESREQRNYFLNFYGRRSLRIFPLYFLFLAVFYFLCPLFLEPDYIERGNQFYFWLYLQDFAITFKWCTHGPRHLWSLAVEEHFYLVWPFVIYCFKLKSILTSIVIILIAATVIKILLLQHDYEPYFLTFTRMDELAAGALIAVLQWNKKLNPANTLKALILALLISVPAVIYCLLYHKSSDPLVQLLQVTIPLIVFTPFIAWLIAAGEDHPINRILSIKPLRFTGRISYGLYVWHYAFFDIFNRHFQTNSFILNLLLSFAGAYILATVSFYLLEAPFLKLKRFFRSAPTLRSGTESTMA